jgi:hypothetical protein
MPVMTRRFAQRIRKVDDHLRRARGLLQLTSQPDKDINEAIRHISSAIIKLEEKYLYEADSLGGGVK